MPINIERFVKLKRFTQEFDFNDTTDQVLPKVGLGSVIYNAIVSLINASKQTLGISGNTLSISGGNSITLPNQLQTLSNSGNTISISGGNSITLPESDNQTLSVSGTTLSISGGNSVTLPSASGAPSVSGAYVVAQVNIPTSAAPAPGSWVASPGGAALAMAAQVNASGPTNSFTVTADNAGDARYIRGSDGVWYGQVFSAASVLTITLPAGVIPTEYAFHNASGGTGGGIE